MSNQDTTQQGQNQNSNSSPSEKKESPMLRKGSRILNGRVVNMSGQVPEGQSIGKEASKAVHTNLDVQDKMIKEAKRQKGMSYGIRTEFNTKKVFNLDESQQILEAFKNAHVDQLVPDFTRMTPIMPLRSGLFEVPLVRFDADTLLANDDQKLKWLLRREKENSERLRIAKDDIPYSQPVISHEFVEDAVMDLAAKHGDEFEVMEDQTYDDRQGYRRYWGVLSKRLDTEIVDSFRTGDVVRVGAMIHNGIDEGISVGFDMFTYCVKCWNGSIGRGKDIASASWKHVGDKEELMASILVGLEQAFDITGELVDIYRLANKQKMKDQHIKGIYDNTRIFDKYYNPEYFDINEKLKHDDPARIRIAAKKKEMSLWEGYNALTEQVWHSELHFGLKSQMLRQLNNQLVAYVKAGQ